MLGQPPTLVLRGKTSSVSSRCKCSFLSVVAVLPRLVIMLLVCQPLVTVPNQLLGYSCALEIFSPFPWWCDAGTFRVMTPQMVWRRWPSQVRRLLSLSPCSQM